MRFTVIFNTKFEQGSSYDLTFEPCPIWSQGNSCILNLNPNNPHLQKGCVKRLIETEGITADKCVIVVHDVGHGSTNDYDVLLGDLDALGLKYQIVRFSS